MHRIPTRAAIVGVGLLVLIVGCSPTATEPTPATTASPTAASTATGQPSPTSEPTASGAPSPSAEPTIDGPSYTNPVFGRDFPDPHVIEVDAEYYAYSTNASGWNVPVIHSTDLASWQRVGDGMPVMPPWARPNFGFTWAPGVIQLGDRFLLYYTARDRETDRQCVGVAVAGTPTGMFRDESEAPLVCQSDLGGTIDAYPFEDDDGTLYLYFKNDGNCCALPVGLWAQELSPDGLSLVGEAVEIARRDQPWEIPLIENPAMVRDAGSYYLFYSANWWEGPDYAVGYAVCETAVGPCTKPLREPFFKFGPDALGPGGQAFFSDADGNLWMAYHAWSGIRVGYGRGGERSLRIEPVTFEDGGPVIEGPTTRPQPMP